MRHVLRRAVGLGGAALVAVAAAVIPALHADAAADATSAPAAKFTTWGVQCGGDTLGVFVNLEHYAKTPDSGGNTVEITDEAGSMVVPPRHFGDFADESFNTGLRADQTHKLTMTIHAQDDPDGTFGGHNTDTMNQWDGTFTDTFGPCTKDGTYLGNGPQPNWSATCDTNGQVTVALNLQNYISLENNLVGVTDATGDVVIPQHAFGKSDTTKSQPLDGSQAHDFAMTIGYPAGFDTNGNGSPDQVDGTFQLSSKPCPKTVSSIAVPPPAGATTTTHPVLAQAGSSGGPLPNTGVNAGFPLLIAGMLLALGGAVLLGLRISARRRTE